MSVGIRICMCIHSESRLGFALENPLLVRGTNLGQAVELYEGTSGGYSLHAGTVDRRDGMQLVGTGTNTKSAVLMEQEPCKAGLQRRVVVLC